MDIQTNQLTKEQAREQFNHYTKELGIKHVFSFDEAWEFAEHKRKETFKAGVMEVEKRISNHSKGLVGEALTQANPLKHIFADGLYIREIFNPKGELLVTKIHKLKHPFFLVKGDMSILTENGEIRIKAPHYGITEPGTKRIIYAHEDCVFVTVHPNPANTQDLKEIEERVIAKDFDDVQLTHDDIKQLKEA